jgi:hypothetical protein
VSSLKDDIFVLHIPGGNKGDKVGAQIKVMLVIPVTLILWEAKGLHFNPSLYQFCLKGKFQTTRISKRNIKRSLRSLRITL